MLSSFAALADTPPPPSLAVLLVRLHVVGFYWGDVSLSNTLFRRDAETFAAYLVDAETGERAIDRAFAAALTLVLLVALLFAVARILATVLEPKGNG